MKKYSDAAARRTNLHDIKIINTNLIGQDLEEFTYEFLLLYAQVHAKSTYKTYITNLIHIKKDVLTFGHFSYLCFSV